MASSGRFRDRPQAAGTWPSAFLPVNLPAHRPILSIVGNDEPIHGDDEVLGFRRNNRSPPITWVIKSLVVDGEIEKRLQHEVRRPSRLPAEVIDDDM